MMMYDPGVVYKANLADSGGAGREGGGAGSERDPVDGGT